MKLSWSRYEPSSEAPWNLQRVVHLHRRAGFGPTWQEAQRDLKSGVDAAVDRMLEGQACESGVPGKFNEMSDVILAAAVASNSPDRLKAWWLYRMVFTPDPLTERLTLMWHNHFATSNLKVNDLSLMDRQNQVLRNHGRNRFAELLTNVVKDPAMLIWLDADSNRKQHPNENLARELMELFTVGVGNYGEQDVKSGARALTGWSAKNGRYRYVEAYHDRDEKSFLGTHGNLDGDDILSTLLEHPATSRRIAKRLCDQFFGENAITNELLESLATQLRERDLDMGWGVETILRSEAFFASNNMGNRVRDPTQFVVGSVRTLELFDPPPSTLVLSEWCARLGQDLFYPPNVFGWPGGREWITTRSMIGRAAFAGALVGGSLRSPVTLPDLAPLCEHMPVKRGPDRMIEFAANLLVPGHSVEFLRGLTNDVHRSKDAIGRQILQTAIASPQAQLG